MLIAVIVSVLFFIACEQANITKLDAKNAAPVALLNSNDQGEDEDNGKKNPPVVNPPKDEIFIPFQIGVAESVWLNLGVDTTPIFDLLTIIRSKEELEQLFYERYYKHWEGTSGPWSGYPLVDRTYRYGEGVFFDNNALIIYCFTAPYGGGIIDITKIQKQGNNLTVFKDFQMGDFANINYWIVVLEVTQTDIDGITVLNIKSE